MYIYVYTVYTHTAHDDRSKDHVLIHTMYVESALSEQAEKPKEELSMAAKKAKLRRLCEVKKNGRLNVPAFLHKLWKEGDKGELAEDLAKCNWDKDCTFS